MSVLEINLYLNKLIEMNLKIKIKIKNKRIPVGGHVVALKEPKLQKGIGRIESQLTILKYDVPETQYLLTN